MKTDERYEVLIADARRRVEACQDAEKRGDFEGASCLKSCVDHLFRCEREAGIVRTYFVRVRFHAERVERSFLINAITQRHAISKWHSSGSSDVLIARVATDEDIARGAAAGVSPVMSATPISAFDRH